MRTRLFILSVLTLNALVVVPPNVRAHCDTMDGPVVLDARRALEKGDVTPVLKWVKQANETEIRAAFQRALAVRKQSVDARELADLYFFETVVRVHRAGEGEAYTGLKPAGAKAEPGIAAADRAVESGKVDGLVKELSEDVSTGIRRRHQRVMETRKHAEDSVAAGREYVEAYVEFIHYVERMHQVAASEAGAHHAAETKALEHH